MLFLFIIDVGPSVGIVGCGVCIVVGGDGYGVGSVG